MFGNSFEQNCKECHIAQSQLEMFMSRYILKYSSEKEVKKAIIHYLKNPIEKNSVMPQGFLNRFGVKEKSTLSENELKNAVDVYYKMYAPKYKLK
jgi:Ca2+-binding EF-hand superfamily protein